VGRIADFFRSPFSLFGSRSTQEDRVVAYLLREHGRGRPLGEVLDDPYVKNRLTPLQRERILERPEIIHAIGEQDIAAMRASLEQRQS
jgi:hypothetical protein